VQRYAFEIQYKGTAYFGWQRQPRQISVQEKIEDCLKQLYGKEISVVGCGRTDTGVHAHRSFFHVDLEDKFKMEILFFKMNRMLPPDISVVAIHPVSPDFHARFGAVSRTYRYFIHRQKDPFLEGLSLHLPQELDIEAMNRSCAYLIGKQDFTSFSKLHTDVKTNICDISSAQWIALEDQRWYFEITADRFLRNMVRAIVGTLLEVGQGKIEASEIEKIISKMDRGEAKLSVPAHALYLWEIKYPEL
jgi:tRNA pseudouridine38-40 synthase